MLRSTLLNSFGIDLRSLAVLRISLAILLLTDLAIRAQSLAAHYTDQGIFPRSTRINLYELHDTNSQASYWWSLHMLNGQWWFQAMLFLVSAIAALSLLIGYRTRIATLISWALLVSLHSRFPEILNGGDDMLRLMLFWGLFLPLGARASFDALRADQLGVKHSTARFLSMATVALILQIVIVYWVNALVKTESEWTTDFSAVYYALNFDLYATPIGTRLLEYPRLLSWLTVSTYYWEFLGPAIALCPYLNKWCRGIAILGFLIFHVGLAACLQLGMFPFVAMAAWTVFLPPEFWHFCEQRIPLLRHLANSATAFLKTRASRLIETATVPRTHIRHWSKCVIAVAVIYVAITNAQFVYESVVAREEQKPYVATAWWEVPGFFLRLEQRWNMFAPRPSVDDGWFVFKGVLRNGEQVDLWQPERRLEFDKPQNVSAQFPNHRWRKYVANFRWNREPGLFDPLSNWLCLRWNLQFSNNDTKREIQRVEIIFQHEETPRPGQPSAPVETQLLWRSDYPSSVAENPRQKWSPNDPLPSNDLPRSRPADLPR